jgi:predicted ATPase/DNA-binding CsgD family transcriptional regulator
MPAGARVTQRTLPAPRSTLIPREREQQEIVRRLLDDQVRLVTLVGPPGAGKTRLAIMAATELADRFTDGVILVDLSPLREATLVPSSIGAALGMREGSERVVERLKTVLSQRHVLLLLDNFEHLLSAAPLVGDLVAACPRVKVLVTSREAFHLASEYRFSVRPLAVPDESDEGNLSLLERVPSVALFCLRVRSIRGDWVLDQNNASAVAELCRRLDGLPLGIELAAAWAGVLSPRAVLARLDACLNSEVAHQPDLPDRHRTLRTAIGWSYDLLPQEERALFDRLAVFSGGWDELAAAAVAGLTRDEVLPLLARLTEKHLVSTAELSADGEPRFGLLDTLHTFAREHLEATDDAARTRRRHAEHHLALAERAERALIGPDQRTWLDRLERELGNLRLALRWAVDGGETELALRLSTALWFFWDMRGHLREGQQWLDTALAMPAPVAGASLRAAALNAAGWLALVQHASYGPAIVLLEDAASTAETAGDKAALVRAQAFLGLTLALGTREYERADAILEQGVTGGRALGDNWAHALALYGQGHIALVREDPERAQDRWQTCAAVVQDVGNLYGLSYLQFRWGVLALLGHDLDRATACLRESLRLSAELDSTREIAVAIAALGLVAGAAGQAARATRLAGATQALLDRAGCDLPAFLRGQFEQSLAGFRVRLGDASFDESFAAGHGLPARVIVSEALGVTEVPGTGTERSAEDSAHAYTPLSDREWEVARLVARGLKNREIAESLVLAERTIGSHLERIFAKLHISNRARLSAWAAERATVAAPFNSLPAEVDPALESGKQPSRKPDRRLRVVGE